MAKVEVGRRKKEGKDLSFSVVPPSHIPTPFGSLAL